MNYTAVQPVKGYRERYRPVPLFTEGYRPAQGYRPVQGYRHVQGGVQACTGRGTGIQAWTRVQALFREGGGGGGGGCTGLYRVQACTRVTACTGRGSDL